MALQLATVDVPLNAFYGPNAQPYHQIPCNTLVIKTMQRSIKFNAAIYGFHVYHDVSQPKEKEILKCSHKENNEYKVFAINVAQFEGRTLRHFPLEIL